MGNPNPDYYVTVDEYDSITAWAKDNDMSLEEALEEGVVEDNNNDNIYVPKALIELWEEGGEFKKTDKTSPDGPYVDKAKEAAFARLIMLQQSERMIKDIYGIVTKNGRYRGTKGDASLSAAQETFLHALHQEMNECYRTLMMWGLLSTDKVFVERVLTAVVDQFLETRSENIRVSVMHYLEADQSYPGIYSGDTEEEFRKDIRRLIAQSLPAYYEEEEDGTEEDPKL